MTAPSIIAPKFKHPGLVGEGLTLKVEIQGDPCSTIKWQIGRKKVKESSKFHLIYNPERGEYGLEIKKVTEEMSEGVWVVASNHHGEDCCHIEVDVGGGVVGRGGSKRITGGSESGGGGSGCGSGGKNTGGSESGGGGSGVSGKNTSGGEGNKKKYGSLKKATSLRQPTKQNTSTSNEQLDDYNNYIKHHSLTFKEADKGFNGGLESENSAENNFINAGRERAPRGKYKTKGADFIRNKSSSLSRIKKSMSDNSRVSDSKEANLDNEISEIVKKNDKKGDDVKENINEKESKQRINTEDVDDSSSMSRIKKSMSDNSRVSDSKDANLDNEISEIVKENDKKGDDVKENINDKESKQRINTEDVDESKDDSSDYEDESDQSEENANEINNVFDNENNKGTNDENNESVDDLWFLYGQNIVGLCENYLHNYNFENEADDEDNENSENEKQENENSSDDEKGCVDKLLVNAKTNYTNGYQNNLPEVFYSSEQNGNGEKNIEKRPKELSSEDKIEDGSEEDEDSEEIDVKIVDARPLNIPQKEKKLTYDKKFDNNNYNKIEETTYRTQLPFKNDNLKKGLSPNKSYDNSKYLNNDKQVPKTIKIIPPTPTITIPSTPLNPATKNVQISPPKPKTKAPTKPPTTATTKPPPTTITQETTKPLPTTTTTQTTNKSPPPTTTIDPSLISKPPHNLVNKKPNSLTTYLTHKKYNQPQNTLKKQKQADRKRCMSADPFKDASEEDEEDEDGHRNRKTTRQRLRSESTANRPRSSSSYYKSRLIPAKSEEILVIRKGSSRRLNRILNESCDMGSSSSLYKSFQSLDRSGDSFNLGKRTLSREWKVVTVTTTEESFVVDDNKKTKTTETSTDDLPAPVNKAPRTNIKHVPTKQFEKVVVVDKNIASTMKDKDTGTQTTQKPPVEVKKPKSYSFGQQTDLKQAEKPKIVKPSKNETTQTQQIPTKPASKMVVIPAVIMPNKIPMINLTNVDEPQLEYRSYEYGEMIQFYSEESEEGRQLLKSKNDSERGFGKIKNDKGRYGKENNSLKNEGNSVIEKSPKSNNLFEKNKNENKTSESSSPNTNSTRKPSILKNSNNKTSTTKSQTSTTNSTKSTTTTTTTSPSKPSPNSNNTTPNLPTKGIANPNPYSSYTTETHNTKLNYMLNNFILQPQKDINFHVEQNVNNITINIDGDDDPEKIIKMIKDNFPGSNSINIHYNDDNGDRIDFTTDEEFTDFQDFPTLPLGRNEFKPSVRYNQNTFTTNKPVNKNSLNISRIGPGKYSLEYTEEADEARNFSNLLDLSKDRKQRDKYHKDDSQNRVKFKTNLNDPQNKFKSTSNSEVDILARRLSTEIVKNVLSPERSVDRYIEMINKNDTEIKVDFDGERKKQVRKSGKFHAGLTGTSLDQKNSGVEMAGKIACVYERDVGMRESMELIK